MTKKQFRQLAYQLAMIEPEHKNDIWERCVTAVATVCAAHNERFNLAKFEEACHSLSGEDRYKC